MRRAIAEARAEGHSSALALRHAELGIILGGMSRYPEAAAEFRTCLGYVQLLQADGQHEEQRLTRLTSPSAPPPTELDYDLRRLEAEVRVALVECLVAAGEYGEAEVEAARAAPLLSGFAKRRLRRRMRVAIAAINEPADPDQRRARQLRLANEHLDAGNLEQALRESLLLIRSADEVGDRRTRAGARQVLGLALEGQGRPAEALPILRDAFDDLRAEGDEAGLVGMAEALAQRLAAAGDAVGAEDVLRAGMDAAARIGDLAAELSAATMLGAVLDSAGDRSAAVALLTDAAARASTAGLELACANALHGAAVAQGGSGRPEDLVEALANLDEAKRLYRKLGELEQVAGCDHEAAAMLGRHGSYDAAQARYAEALALYEELPPNQRDPGSWPDEVADCRANLAWLRGDRSNPPAKAFQSGGHSMSHA